eukprot:437078_1
MPTDAKEQKTAESNSRNIPQAVFIENVSEYVSKSGKNLETIEKDIDQLYRKYKFMESQLIAQKGNLLQKIPDIKTAQKSLKFLVSKQEDGEETFDTQFMLADNVYASAEVETCDKVCLWLGANVMLEYSYDEAGELLKRNQNSAEKNLEILNGDLAFLKDQCTISEVNIARLHNHKVELKKVTKVEEQKSDS